MGVDYTAKAGIGIRLSADDAITLGLGSQDISEVEEVPFRVDDCGSYYNGEIYYYLSIYFPNESFLDPETTKVIEREAKELRCFMRDNGLSNQEITLWEDLLIH